MIATQIIGECRWDRFSAVELRVLREALGYMLANQRLYLRNVGAALLDEVLAAEAGKAA